MRAFAGVDVDREGNRALRGDPADVRPEGRLVDAAVGVHRENGGGDEAVEIQGHRRLRGVVETPIVIVCYEAASSGSSKVPGQISAAVMKGEGRPPKRAELAANDQPVSYLAANRAEFGPLEVAFDYPG